MEKARDELGFIEIEKLKCEAMQYINKYTGHFSFYYKDKKYFFKKSKIIDEVYNELIAEEIAKQFGIPCTHYDLASNYNFIGVISESFLSPSDKYITMEQILKGAFKEGQLERYNNLEDIWVALSQLYGNEQIKILMEELINIFIFDILIGNIDRHIENFGIVENEYGIHFAKVFDNEKMLSYYSINRGIYSVGINREDHHTTVNGYSYNLLSKFICYSDSIYRDIIVEKLKIIDEDNIEEILKKVEKRIKTKIQPNVRDRIKVRFKMNYLMIEQVINDRKVKIK